jgi:hypothetical protein
VQCVRLEKLVSYCSLSLMILNPIFFFSMIILPVRAGVNAQSCGNRISNLAREACVMRYPL